MTLTALDRAAREAGGRIIAALAARFRDLDLAEDGFAEACARAAAHWRTNELPRDPAAWLYRAAERAVLDVLRARRARDRAPCDPPAESANAEDAMADDSTLIPDERLRLIFVCCHPAVAVESRAALTLRLVCGLPAAEIARAFLISEATLAQRLVRAKRKIAEAGIRFDVPAPEHWPERVDAVLSTLEVAYAKAHEDAAGVGTHAGYAAEMLDITGLLAVMLSREAEVQALAATVRYAEARRPARLDGAGAMVPLSDQDPREWQQSLIAEAMSYFARAKELGPQRPRTIQAAIHAVWCTRKSRDEPAPWRRVLALYDSLLEVRDDAIVRLNRAVAVAEVEGAAAALDAVAAFDTFKMAEFLPYHAVRADLLRRLHRTDEARTAYDHALALGPAAAERLWLQRQRDNLGGS